MNTQRPRSHVTTGHDRTRHDFVHIGLTKKMFLMTPNVGEDAVQETSYTVHRGDPFAKQALVCQVRMLPPVTLMPPLLSAQEGPPRPATWRGHRGTPGDTGAAQHLLMRGPVPRHLATALHASYKMGTWQHWPRGLWSGVGGQAGRPRTTAMGGLGRRWLRTWGGRGGQRVRWKNAWYGKPPTGGRNASSLCPFVLQRSKAGSPALLRAAGSGQRAAGSGCPGH